MDDDPDILICPPNLSRSPTSKDFVDPNSLHDNETFEDIIGYSVEDLEVELRRKEKELYLCSRLGLFLAQEVEELVSQRKGLLSDHTRTLLELQEYRNSRHDYLDISDDVADQAGASRNGHERSGSTISSHDHQRQSVEGSSGDHKVSTLQTQAASCSNLPPLNRTASLESLGGISNADSTVTSFSTRDLRSDLDLVQESHDRITKLEVQLDNTRAKYRSLMTKYSHKLKEMSRQLGSCVNKARPYFEAVKKAKKCQVETQQAAIKYKRAVNLHKAARDMVRVAEERVMEASDKLDPTWQEMLNQANLKVTEASDEKNKIHKNHSKATKAFQVAEEKKSHLQTTLQKYVIKSKPYFTIQREFQAKLEAITRRLNSLELKLMEARQSYSNCLAKLKSPGSGANSSKAMKSLSERGMGVGAENPLGLPNSAASLLPKPALDYLEKEATFSDGCRDGASKSNCDDPEPEIEVVSPKTKIHYNPYDLLYLTDIASDSGSNYDSEDDDYIQDF